MLADLKYALRQFARNLGFTLFVGFTLALGIGATTAIFSVINATGAGPKVDVQPNGHLTDEHARAVTLALQKSESDTSADLKAFFREELAAIRREISAMEIRLEARIDTKIAEAKAEMIRWMFLFWVSQIGITLAVLKFGR